MATLAMLMPLAFGGGPVSATISNAKGLSTGIESRDAKSVSTPANDPKNGVCSDAPVAQFPLNVTGLAAYKYPLTGTTTVSAANIEGYDSTNSTFYTYNGPITVDWGATTVWDGPSGTTQAMNGNTTPATCNYGWEWPVTSATIGTGTGAPPGTSISCSSPTVGSQGTAGSNGNTKSYYARPKVNPNNIVTERGQEVIRLVFPAGNCTINGHILNDADNSFTLHDGAHAFCQDLNATQTSDPANQVGVTHCISNYTIS